MGEFPVLLGELLMKLKLAAWLFCWSLGCIDGTNCVYILCCDENWGWDWECDCDCECECGCDWIILLLILKDPIKFCIEFCIYP